mgnify:CR=1 FL=1|tara:strand:+ start:698 stop:1807 length:1110 start_codon:yes stop_codon:yes gene_type:complete
MLPSEIKKKDKKDEILFPWTKEQEELLAEWAEKAMCYRWLHGRSEKSYRIKNYTFTIPVIILSTLTGTANFAMDSFVPEEHKQIAMAGVGSVNIFAGILSTLQNFLRYAELMESHRLSEVQWSKFGRNIEVELALDPKRRKPAHEFLEICRAEYDRLIEQSPTIDDNIIKQFRTTFKKVEIKVPPMCNGLDKVKIFERPEEDKIADIMTNVSSKLLQKKKTRKWTIDDIPQHKQNIPSEAEFKPISENVSNGPSDTKRDLDELKSFSRVSSLKKMNMNKPRSPKKSDNPKEEIHKILRDMKSPEPVPDTEPTKEQPDIETGLSVATLEDIQEDTQGDTPGTASFLAGIEDMGESEPNDGPTNTSQKDDN